VTRDLMKVAMAAGLKDAGVDRAIRGRKGASDHAPAWAVIEQQAGRKRTRTKPSRE
jgi:exodeoxyribonuclease-3